MQREIASYLFVADIRNLKFAFPFFDIENLYIDKLCDEIELDDYIGRNDLFSKVISKIMKLKLKHSVFECCDYSFYDNNIYIRMRVDPLFMYRLFLSKKFDLTPIKREMSPIRIKINRMKYKFHFTIENIDELHSLMIDSYFINYGYKGNKKILKKILLSDKISKLFIGTRLIKLETRDMLKPPTFYSDGDLNFYERMDIKNKQKIEYHVCSDIICFFQVFITITCPILFTIILLLFYH